MNIRSVFFILGKIILLVGLLMLVPVAVALIYREAIWHTYLAVAASTIAVGAICSQLKKKKLTIRAREGIAIAGLVWMLVSFFGALPFYISGEIPSLVDAVFETVSGFTTTGSTILSDIEALSHASLFWRSFTHWIGGMGVLVLGLAILPGDDTQSMHIMRAEVPGPTVGKLVSRIRVTARLLYIIYISLTLLEAVFLLIGGMPLYDSIVTSLATAGTGGFAIKNASIAAYDSAYIDAVITAFMLIFSVNFTLYYMILLGQLKTAIRSEELRWFFGIVVAATVLITINVLPLYSGIFEALRYSSFQVASIISTCGFITANYDLWPTFSQAVLLLLMFIGGCAGSTGGGIKVYRVVVICKTAFANVRRQLFPRSVAPLKHEGKLLDDDIKNGITGYMFTYIAIAAVSVLIISLDNVSFAESFTAMVACLNNIGPGLGKIGAVGNFGDLSILSKIVLIFDMLAGRLEFFPMLAMFYPATWKKG